MAGAVLGAEDEELKPYPAERLLPEPKEHTQRGQRELILKVALWPPCALVCRPAHIQPTLK